MEQDNGVVSGKDSVNGLEQSNFDSDRENALERLECSVDRITFQNPENGYCVLKCSTKQEEKIPLVGIMPNVRLGSLLIVKGKWEVSKRFGRQFKVYSCVEQIPVTEYGIERYLCGLIKGIGSVLAKKIVKKFGMDTPRIIAEEPMRLLEVSNIGKKRIEMIHNNWVNEMEIHDIMMFLLDHGISPNYAMKIYKHYGMESIELITENPYRLASEIWGIGFLLADRIATSFGFVDEHPFRCQSGIIYTLTMLSEQGHVFCPYEELIVEAMEILKVPDSAVINALSDLIRTHAVINDDNRIYLPAMFYAERRVARQLHRLASISYQKNISMDEAYAIGKSIDVEYDKLQAKAVSVACSSGVMVLTGGPGTGKTTTIRGILKLLSKMKKTVFLAAPTGRAAKRMTEATETEGTDMEAKTIHRLLEYTPMGKYRVNSSNPLHGDYLIIDECSMIDIRLMDAVLDAVPNNMQVLLVGDVDQLPSVGPGNVLKDIIASEVCPVVCLTQIFRQAMGSNIIVNAHAVNKGHMFRKDNSEQSDFFFIETDKGEPEDVANLIVDLVSHRLPNKYHVNPLDIQVLCPMRKGVVGTNTLNLMLQEALNPGEGGICRRGVMYRERDKVMQLRNNYDKEVYNGDIGIITAVDKETGKTLINFDGRVIEYDEVDFEEVIHAYATTVHKSQGSEYKVVVMPMLTTHYVMLQRNLLYTGITRAKEIMVLVGTRKAISMAIRNHKVTQRHTYLAERLRLLNQPIDNSIAV